MIISSADCRCENIFSCMKIFCNIVFHHINPMGLLVIERINKIHVRTFVIIGICRNKFVGADTLAVYEKINQPRPQTVNSAFWKLFFISISERKSAASRIERGLSHLASPKTSLCFIEFSTFTVLFQKCRRIKAFALIRRQGNLNFISSLRYVC